MHVLYLFNGCSASFREFVDEQRQAGIEELKLAPFFRSATCLSTPHKRYSPRQHGHHGYCKQQWYQQSNGRCCIMAPSSQSIRDADIRPGELGTLATTASYSSTDKLTSMLARHQCTDANREKVETELKKVCTALLRSSIQSDVNCHATCSASLMHSQTRHYGQQTGPTSSWKRRFSPTQPGLQSY